jgi:polyphenol oxidase
MYAAIHLLRRYLEAGFLFFDQYYKMKDVEKPVPPGKWLRPAVFAPFTTLAAAQSTRHGGVSSGPYTSMNLGKSTDDDPACVAENRRIFCAGLGFQPEQLAWSYQVHGDLVRLALEPGGAEGYDALVTHLPGILLAVSVADCTPVLIYDARHQVVAAVHAGWKGSAAQLVGKTLRLMRDHYDTEGADCYAFVGACIDVCSFEVGAEVAEAFDDSVKRFDAQRGKFMVDLKQANARQLLNFGVPETQLEISPYDTFRDHAHFFSHRADKGTTGRMLAAIGMLP